MIYNVQMDVEIILEVAFISAGAALGWTAVTKLLNCISGVREHG